MSKTRLLLIGLLVLGLTIPATAALPLYKASITLGGAVNGQPVTATGLCTYDLNGTPTHVVNDITYLTGPALASSANPALWIPIINTVTIINTFICIYKNGAINIDSATCGNFTVTRVTEIYSKGYQDPAHHKGTITVVANIHQRTADSSEAQVTVSGTYDGPTALTKFSGYAMTIDDSAGSTSVIKSIAPYHQQIWGPTDTLDLWVSIRWADSSSCPAELPFEEKSVLAIDPQTISFDGSRLYFEGYGHYEPSGPIPTLSEWGAIIFGSLLLASVAFYIWRKRRAVAA